MFRGRTKQVRNKQFYENEKVERPKNTSKTKHNFKPNDAFIDKLNDKRKRKNVPNIVGKLPCVNIDLPIIEVEAVPSKTAYKFDWRNNYRPKWETVRKSCIIVDSKTKRILNVFVYSRDDPNISKVLFEVDKLVEGMDKYLKEKSHQFYSGFGSKKLNDGTQEKLEHRVRYIGKNWLEGLQRYLDGSLGENVISYYPRKVEANNDNDYLERLLWLFCGLYELEKRHTPATANYRLQLAKKADYLGCFTPNCPIELNPSTSMGGSINFASDTHDDSSVKGTTEAIIWRPKKGKPYLFANSVAKLYFDISEDCILYQVGTDAHSTINTGENEGVGFVNLSKKILLYDTPITKNWFNAWRNWFKKN